MSKVVMNLVFSNGKNPISVFITFQKQTRSDYLKDIAKEAEQLIRKKHPEYGPLIDWTYHGHENDIVFMDDEPEYCGKCVNAFVEPELEPDYDFSSRSVGESNKGYRMMLNSGARRKTHISLERWNEQHQQWETEGIYIPKYCPECGRELKENAKGGSGIYIECQE